MNKQELKNIPIFIKKLEKMSQAVFLACDSDVAADISLKINIAIKLINDLKDENTILKNLGTVCPHLQPST